LIKGDPAYDRHIKLVTSWHYQWYSEYPKDIRTIDRHSHISANDDFMFKLN
jgi:hypothetical protein